MTCDISGIEELEEITGKIRAWGLSGADSGDRRSMIQTPAKGYFEGQHRLRCPDRRKEMKLFLYDPSSFPFEKVSK